MHELLKKIYHLPLILKRATKQKQFKINSIHGINLNVSHDASCVSLKKESIEIGDNCDICGQLKVVGNGKISIGNNTTIRGNSIIGSVNNIEIGDCVIISNNVHIYDNNNHPTDPEARIEMCKKGFYGELWGWEHADNKPIVIEDNVWIGERSTILKGVRIGKGSIIASNTVVTKNIPQFSIAAGNPAIVVKRLEE